MTAVSVITDRGYRTIAKARTHVWNADEPIDAGGEDTSPTPMEMLLGSLGSCIIITVQMYANRKNWPLDKVEVNLQVERFNAPDYPAYKGDAQFVSEIREQVVLHGDALSSEQRERLMEIATKCPVRRLLSNPVFFVEGTHEQS